MSPSWSIEVSDKSWSHLFFVFLASFLTCLALRIQSWLCFFASDSLKLTKSAFKFFLTDISPQLRAWYLPYLRLEGELDFTWRELINRKMMQPDPFGGILIVEKGQKMILILTFLYVQTLISPYWLARLPPSIYSMANFYL